MITRSRSPCHANALRSVVIPGRATGGGVAARPEASTRNPGQTTAGSAASGRGVVAAFPPGQRGLHDGGSTLLGAGLRSGVARGLAGTRGRLPTLGGRGRRPGRG